MHDNDGNENNAIIIRADIATKSLSPNTSAHDEPEFRPRVDSVLPSQASDVPSVVVDKVDSEPRHGDDLGSEATQGQKVAHDLRAADAQPDETNIHPHASEDLQHSTTLSQSKEGKTNTINEHENVRTQAAPQDEHTDLAEDDGQQREQETQTHENIPLFAHECTYQPSSEHDAASFDPSDDNLIDRPSGAQTPELAATLGYDPRTQHDSAREESPLFTHECASSQEELPEPKLAPSIKLSQEGSALKNVESANVDEDESSHRDPSIEKFPDTREDIMMHLQQTESRLGHDDSDVDGIPPSPLMSKSDSPTLSRTESNTSHSAISPLNDIAEDPIAEADEAEGDEDEPNNRSYSTGKLPEAAHDSTGISPITGSFQEEITVQKKPADSGQYVLNSTLPAVLSPPTPPLTPEDSLKAARHASSAALMRREEKGKKVQAPENPADRPGPLADTGRANLHQSSATVTIAPTPVITGALRQRRPDSDGINEDDENTSPNDKTFDSASNSRAVSPSSTTPLIQKEDQQGTFGAIWRVLFGSWLAPLGNWIARLCGGRRNAV